MRLLAALIHLRVAATSWTPTARLEAAGGRSGDAFGFAVALQTSGDAALTLAVGAAGKRDFSGG